MKTTFIFGPLALSLMLFSCGSNQAKEQQSQVKNLDIQLDEVALSSKLNTIDLTKVERLTQIQYDTLQLAKVEGLQGYDIADLTMGRVLLSNENGRILTIQVVTDGEITEYLLSYDKNGVLQGNLLVAYEDMVEYYSEVTSRINSNKIMVQTVNFTYGDETGNTLEKADTAVISYQITKDLKIVTD
ncbi:hypothetical protein GGR21_003431 [Dysgonomonas hofstadii]|uniref:Lipoprotein n=1 Tax=Dysgonomonas hofstadii TaxID=637886 RepID=A0A840CV13_9BACT|nr:hypothetical protein [Dysgonomonas hofstadii]MBB4037514.1 hypothetical protein [Dysgonomonas hofstadii]